MQKLERTAERLLYEQDFDSLFSLQLYPIKQILETDLTSVHFIILSVKPDKILIHINIVFICMISVFLFWVQNVYR